MTKRTTLLFIGAGLFLTLGSRPSTLQAQQPTPPLPPTEFPRYPVIPPEYPQPQPRPRPPAWLEFLKNNEFLAPYIFAGVVTLAIAIVIGIPLVVCRGIARLILVLWSCRDRDRGDGPRAPPPGDGGRFEQQK